MKRAAIYVRVSTKEQKEKGLSVDSQLLALREYCNNNGYVIAGEYNDAGISARKKYINRPALLQLINDCKQGKIDIILFTKLDRWFRSVADYYQVQTLLDSYKVPWRAIWEDYETETSTGLFKVNIMLSVSQNEADKTSERTKEAVKYRRLRGDFVGGRCPRGYRRENKKLVFDEETYDAINAMFRTYLSCFSIAKATEAVAEYGLHIATSQICRMLKSPAYAGNASGSECPAYITWDEHLLILTNSTKRNRTPKRSDRVYLFSGLCRCGYCGGRMVSRVNRWVKNGQHLYYPFYSCAAHNDKRNLDCPGVNLAETKIEAYLLEHLESELKMCQSEFELEQENKVIYENKIKALEQKLKRIGVRYEDGDIPFEEYKDKRFAIKNEIAEYKDKIDNARSIPSLPDNWKDLYNSLTPDNKRGFWLNILKEIDITKEGINIVFPV